MTLDPSVLATMQMGYNIEASLRRAGGISSDGNTPTAVTAKFVAALSLCSDVSFVIQGTNKSGASFSIVLTAGTGLVAFYASSNFRREHQWLFGQRPHNQSVSSTESAAPAPGDSCVWGQIPGTDLQSPAKTRRVVPDGMSFLRPSVSSRNLLPCRRTIINVSSWQSFRKLWCVTPQQAPIASKRNSFTSSSQTGI